MKRLTAITLMAFLIFSASEKATAEDYYPGLITLISELANMAVMASHCEAHLINYGSKAMESKECIKFMVSFIKKWPNRNDLEEEILVFVRRIEKGDMICDERCSNMLLRCEELRISIIYVLNYMDYVVEEGI